MQRFVFRLLLIVFFIPFVKGKAQYLPWTYTNIIGNERQGGINPDMEVDPLGGVHMLFWDADNDKLVYVYRTPGTHVLSYELVDSIGLGGWKAAITLDNSNTPHIAYYANVADKIQVRYAKRTAPGVWDIESVPGHPTRGHWGDYGPLAYNNVTERINTQIDLVLTPSGTPQLIFMDAWMRDGSFPTCVTSSDYGFKMVQAFKSGSNWSVKVFQELDDLYMSCGGFPPNDNTLPKGDRFGEFASIANQPGGGLSALTVSRFNDQVLLYRTVLGDSIWDTTVVDMGSSAYGAGWTQINRFFTWEGSSLAVGSDGTQHMAYTSSMFYGDNFCCLFYNDLAYTRIEPAPNDTLKRVGFGTGSYREFTSIQVDGRDSVFISYADLTFGHTMLKQSFDGGSTWQNDTIMHQPLSCVMPMRLQNDTLYLLMYDYVKQSLTLGTRGAYDSLMQWSWQLIAFNEERGNQLGSWIETTPTDTTLYFIFDENFREELYYGMGNSSSSWSWSFERIDSSGSNFRGLTFLTGPLNEKVAVYSSGDLGDLKMAVNTGGVWTYDTIEAGANASYSSAVFSSTDTIYVAYFQGNDLCVKFAKKHFYSGAWIYDVIDCGTNPVGEFPNILLDAAEVPRIAYYDDFNRVLKYAYQDPVSRNWIKETVFDNSPSTVGKYASMKMGNDDLPKIAFLDDQNLTLYLAERNIGGAWKITKLDSGNTFGIGRPIRLEIDQFGNPWVAYNYSSNFDEIKLLHRDSIWRQVSVSDAGRIANSFNFHIVGGDMYIIGKKNEPTNTGLAMLYAEKGIFIQIEEPVLQTGPGIICYPNPLNEKTTFRIELKNPEIIDLRILDLSGKEVGRVIQSQKLGAGTHEYLFDASGLSPGIYFYECSGSLARTTGKMIVQ